MSQSEHEAPVPSTPAPVAWMDEPAFTAWFLANYPPGCVITNPAWHAPKIWRAAHPVPALPDTTPSYELRKALNGFALRIMLDIAGFTPEDSFKTAVALDEVLLKGFDATDVGAAAKRVVQLARVSPSEGSASDPDAYALRHAAMREALHDIWQLAEQRPAGWIRDHAGIALGMKPGPTERPSEGSAPDTPIRDSGHASNDVRNDVRSLSYSAAASFFVTEANASAPDTTPLPDFADQNGPLHAPGIASPVPPSAPAPQEEAERIRIGGGHIVCPGDWIIPSAPDTKLDEVTPLERALQLATKAHAGQRDKQGLPYILHVLRVVNGCATDDERTVAALHDVVEDAGVTLKDLADFPAHILAAVDAITRREDEVYPDYIARAGRDYIARAVKIVDLRDNLSRAYQLPASAGTRLHFRYWRALEQLGASSPPEGEDTRRLGDQ